MTEPCDLTARTARALIGRRQLSPRELLESCLARIEAVNPAVNAFVALDVDGARAAAQAAEAAVMRGEALGALHGLPIGVKDLEETAGLRTTFGSPIFANHVPKQDYLTVARLRAAGAIILGKTNTPEFGLGANTRNRVYGATGNPFNPALSAAGSSGGSAAALACHMVPLCTGSDMGGSLRNPASFCGIIGMRPGAGIIAAPHRAHGWSHLSSYGPMGRDVADVALMLSVMAGEDGRDPISRPLSAPVEPLPPIDLASLRLAFTEDFGQAPSEAAIRAAFRARAAALAPMFARAVAAHPDCTGGDAAFQVLRAVGVMSAHDAKVRERPADCGPNVIANVEEARGYTLGDVAAAQAAQQRLYLSFQQFFAEHDVLIAPTVGISPRPWRELFPAEVDGRPMQSYIHWLAMVYYVTLSGHPALSLPMGLDANGMPFGLQIIGPRGGDALVLRVAAAVEAAFVGYAEFGRPLPNLGALGQSAPLREAEGFLGFA
jgi:Asp-tRNA(Asn)/Glu-tRNA(Gln) amidotransferase A subunit family amidase